MFLLRAPGPARIERELRAAAASELNDPRLRGGGALELLGAHDPARPRDFHLDSYGARLGSGAGCFAAAVSALRAWAMYPPRWTKVHSAEAQWRVGAVYLAQIDHFGFCSLLPGRILAVDEGTHCVGYTFGTLAGHAEAGVERFRVERDPNTDLVEYRVLAVSRPVGLARLASPVARRMQLRFHRESSANMRTVTEQLSPR